MLDLIIVIMILLSIIIVPLALFFYLADRCVNVRGNQLIIVYRSGNDGDLRITKISNENTFVMPFIESYTILNSDMQNHDRYIENIKCKYGIPINLEIDLLLSVIPGPGLTSFIGSSGPFRTTYDLHEKAVEHVKTILEKTAVKFSVEAMHIGGYLIPKKVLREANPGLKEKGFELIVLSTRISKTGYFSLLEQLKMLDIQRQKILGVTPDEKEEYQREIDKKKQEIQQELEAIRQEYGVDMEEVEKELRSIRKARVEED